MAMPRSFVRSPRSRTGSGGGSGSWAPAPPWSSARRFWSRATSPAELPQPFVGDAEVMPDLVDHCPADLLDDLLLGVADRADCPLVDRNPVRKHPRVVRGAAGQRDALVEPEQAARAGAMLDQDGHVLHELGKLSGQGVEGLGDHLLEGLRIHRDHRSIVRQPPIAWNV